MDKAGAGLAFARGRTYPYTRIAGKVQTCTDRENKPQSRLQSIITTVSDVLGYRNEIYRAGVAPVPSEEQAPSSVCMPGAMADWQNRGWSIFSGIEKAENTATRANATDASIDGLSYTLHSCQEKSAAGVCEKIFIRIDSWRYDRNGETTDLPVMAIVMSAALPQNPAQALESLKVMARPLHLTEKVASRAINAALFLINQINAGQVPDFERVLELHRLHPDLNRSAMNDVGEGRNVLPAKAANANRRNGEDEQGECGVSEQGC